MPKRSRHVVEPYSMLPFHIRKYILQFHHLLIHIVTYEPHNNGSDDNDITILQILQDQKVNQSRLHSDNDPVKTLSRQLYGKFTDDSMEQIEQMFTSLSVWDPMSPGIGIGHYEVEYWNHSSAIGILPWLINVTKTRLLCADVDVYTYWKLMHRKSLKCSANPNMLIDITVHWYWHSLPFGMDTEITSSQFPIPNKQQMQQTGNWHICIYEEEPVYFKSWQLKDVQPEKNIDIIIRYGVPYEYIVPCIFETDQIGIEACMYINTLSQLSMAERRNIKELYFTSYLNEYPEIKDVQKELETLKDMNNLWKVQMPDLPLCQSGSMNGVNMKEYSYVELFIANLPSRTKQVVFVNSDWSKKIIGKYFSNKQLTRSCNTIIVNL